MQLKRFLQISKSLLFINNSFFFDDLWGWNNLGVVPLYACLLLFAHLKDYTFMPPSCNNINEAPASIPILKVDQLRSNRSQIRRQVSDVGPAGLNRRNSWTISGFYSAYLYWIFLVLWISSINAIEPLTLLYSYYDWFQKAALPLEAKKRFRPRGKIFTWLVLQCDLDLGMHYQIYPLCEPRA